MSVGRTSWWPCDSAEHDRELVVELGDEFGSAAHALTRIMKDLAQAQRADGEIRTGFRVLALKAHLAVDTGDASQARALARRIVERAGEIGWLDDLAVDPDGRRFTARVSGWMSDSARGRAAIKKATSRQDPPVPAEGDVSPEKGTTLHAVSSNARLSPETGTSAAVVPSDGDVSGSVPLNREEKRTELPPNPPHGGRQRDGDAFMDRMRGWAREHFPGTDPGLVAAAIQRVRRAGQEPTVENLIKHGERYPQFALMSSPAPAEEARC